MSSAFATAAAAAGVAHDAGAQVQVRRPSVRVPHIIPPAPARFPRLAASPVTVMTAADEGTFDSEDEDEAQRFEACVLARAGNRALAIPTAPPERWRAARPLAELRELDAHHWGAEVGLLGKWARGAAVGALANSVTEAMFAPGSPPRAPRVAYNYY